MGRDYDGLGTMSQPHSRGQSGDRVRVGWVVAYGVIEAWGGEGLFSWPIMMGWAQCLSLTLCVNPETG
jgi:hypothetical protein